ncbi:DUF1631 domain-containing protein [Hymenobacter sp. 5317J-9]|uniref:tetratricopeptide repeat protein n=1 Tax=Hymenobacter sp. 5317J-9 TaxID=2932250 RepID=UPI001FD6B48F|nr:DUF1631 domain-containing protein [Hymenobacter sp. 5317J-9]UOQ99786.1 DUF1631 domain-containing protein [Hymenobacter sp. 5317J-9]
MKYVALVLLLIGGPGWALLTGVRDRNVAVRRGTAAYQQGAAARAAQDFAEALNAKARRTPDPRLVLNLAHAQTRAGQLAPAASTYSKLLTGAPPALGSVARQQLAVLAAQRGELAQAVGLLRQALLLDPGNKIARYDYEVLTDYLARRPNTPQIPSPPPPAQSNQPKNKEDKPTPDKNGSAPNQPATKEGTDRKGETNDQKQSTAPPSGSPQSRPTPAGQPDNQRPAPTQGASATGGRAPGPGPAQPLPTGEVPGQLRGLDRNAGGEVSNGRSTRPGTEAATPADVQLQTQRERLQAMNLSPAQARQLLETLRAQEQQYLQQLARPAERKPDPNKPTW